ncbi:hypothetical protein Ait01nite_070050 [Actinoplanes italicus]|uniref:Uncharacterized protein n=1 Tax=Actinoplanes italicus TaxID=113567 RepID=A0A2T0JYC9_9ACTN|nr:hypothetical protein [Actinoplanes italicus]PRX13293.1 hypothetical protein CLV67_1252 [Actinoplanes italicus]GIE33960.1 hypothetical protein Ait01nite_070050 [Actinoplanes italicus]
MSLEPDRDVADLYRSALNELYETSVDDRALDPLTEVDLTYRLIRGLRADSRIGEAYTLAIERDENFYSASGAETRTSSLLPEPAN